MAGSDGLERRHLFGLDFVSASSYEPVIAQLMGRPPTSADGFPLPVVITPNVDHLVRLDRMGDRVANAIAAGAAIVLPDGQPIVWASRWLGDPLEARLAGSSLVAELWPRLIAAERRCLVVATTDRIAQRAAAAGDAVDCLVAPMLDLADREHFELFVDRCFDAISRSAPDVVFVTLGFPKQCNVIDGLILRCRASSVSLPWFVAIGASFEMLFGEVRRAPEWVQRIGMEWFYRFVQEPRRLFRRYFIDDVAFIGLIRREHRRRRDDGSR